MTIVSACGSTIPKCFTENGMELLNYGNELHNVVSNEPRGHFSEQTSL